jgi:hypothetical protein
VAAPEPAPGEGSTLTREVPRAALADAIPHEEDAATRASGTTRPQRLGSTLDRLTETIDADIDADLEAELRDVVRVVGGLRKARLAAKATAGESTEAASGDATATAEALSDLTDEGSQKTREVLQIGPDWDEGGAQASGAPRGPATPPPRPTTERDEAADRAAVQARYALVEDGDYFQILGVARETDAGDIRRAGETLLLRLASSSLHPFVAAELADQLKEIRIVVGEAVQLMADDRLRERYRANLPGPPAPSPDGAAGA